MDDILVVETAHDMDDGVHAPNMPQELVSQTFPLAGSLDETGDVHNLHGRRENPFRLYILRQLVHPGIWYLDDSHIGLDGAERIIGRFRLGRG